MKPMRWILLFFLGWMGVASAEPRGEFEGTRGAPVEEPSILLRMIQAMQASKFDVLQSKHSTDGGTETYHLTKAEYLGPIERGKERAYLANAFFIRSAPKNRDTAPPRGHTFLVMFSKDYQVLGQSRIDGGNYRLRSNGILECDGAPVMNFMTINEGTRHYGYGVGSGHLPYPFSDRITEEEWQSGSFREKKVITE